MLNWLVDCILGAKMFLITEEEKAWWIGVFNCHNKKLYIYPIRSEREKTLFKGGQYCETANEVLNIIEKEWER